MNDRTKVRKVLPGESGKTVSNPVAEFVEMADETAEMIEIIFVDTLREFIPSDESPEEE